MTKLNEIYKSKSDENMVEVMHSDNGTLTCDGYPMILLLENKIDASIEKHKPVIEKFDNGIMVSVGAILHPMEKNHYIEFIEVIKGNRISKLFLKPGDKPQGFFSFDFSLDIMVRAYCNIHGLWTN